MYILMHMRARAHGCVRACSACARVLRVEAYARTYGSTCGEPAPLTPSLWPELSSTKQSFVESAQSLPRYKVHNNNNKKVHTAAAWRENEGPSCKREHGNGTDTHTQHEMRTMMVFFPWGTPTRLPQTP